MKNVAAVSGIVFAFLLSGCFSVDRPLVLELENRISSCPFTQNVPYNIVVFKEGRRISAGRVEFNNDSNNMCGLSRASGLNEDGFQAVRFVLSATYSSFGEGRYFAWSKESLEDNSLLYNRMGANLAFAYKNSSGGLNVAISCQGHNEIASEQLRTYLTRADIPNSASSCRPQSLQHLSVIAQNPLLYSIDAEFNLAS